MRKANDSQFLFNEGKLIGINLGADFTSEHEWGIKGIKKLFGIAPKDADFGLKRRKITRVPDTIVFGWSKGKMPKSEGFYLVDAWNSKAPDFSNNSELHTWKGNLACAWDESEFGVFSSDLIEQGYLKTIFDAFRDGDGAVFLGGGGVFQNSGLVLSIASKIPASFTRAWEDGDRENYEMEQEVVKSGIRELLAKAGKRYFALAKPHHREIDGKLTFWLNPMDQDKNNYGWFTIDDLKEWADGKGKIPISGKVV